MGNHGIGRRQFLVGAGATGAVVATQQFSALSWILQAANDTTRTSFRLIRAEDQMVVNVDLLDAVVSGGNIIAAGANPGLRFTFGSQHTTEEPLDGQPTYPNLPTAPSTPLAHRSAEQSRIVVDINTPIPFSVAGLLDLSGRVPRVDGRASTAGTPPPLTQKPAADVTSIELPTDLVLSTNTAGRWFTDASPQTFDDVTEAWRVRLGRQVGGSPVEAPQTFGVVRAIFSENDSDPSPLTVLQAADRAKIVALTAQQAAPADPIVFAPIDRLWLSPAGGRLDTEVVFSPNNSLGLISWAQKVVTGRDVYATVAKQGYILPWGLPAAVVEQTERQFVATSGGGITAAMVRNDYLVTAPLDVDTPAGAAFDGRGTPFPTMSMAANDPVAINRGVIAGINEVTQGFWVELAGGSNPLMQIPVEVTDHAGRRHAMRLPGIFIYSDVANTVGTLSPPYLAVSEWNNRAAADRDMNAGGSKITWAPERSEGSATRSTETIRMKAYYRNDGGSSSTGVPAFGPLVDEAWIIDEVVNGLAGVVGEAIKVIPDSLYLLNGDTNGSGNNPAGNFLEVAGSFVQGAVTGDGGGMVSPSFDFKGLSQSFGAGPSIGAGGSWDPSIDLAGLGGKILGAVDFVDLLTNVVLSGAGLGDFEIPRFILEPPTIPDELCYKFQWETTLSSWSPSGSGSLVFLNAAEPDSGFTGVTPASIESVSCISTTTGEASSSVDVRIEKFALQLPPGLPAILIQFRDLRYEQRIGQEADTTVDIVGIKFVGILGWLDPIAALLGNLSDTFGIDVNLAGVTAQGKLPIPDINLGVMGIADLEPSFAVTLPFTGDPLSMSMTIGTKQSPFTIFVLSAGGTGYVEIDSTANGIERLSAGLSVSFSWGVDVAVAEVTITGTIGGGIEISGDDITFNLFIQIRGTVSAFGLSAFLEARLELEYSTQTQLLSGTAKVTVGFDTPFGAASVSFSLTQEIALGDGAQNAALRSPAGLRSQPRLAPATGASFGDRFTNTQWSNYCGAFA